jgi:putative membrane protein
MHGNYGQIHDGFLGLSHFGYGGIIMMGIGLVLILALVYLTLRKGGVTRSYSNENESPLDMLQKRYVNGDISQDEYLEKKEVLKQK